jgi:hypothetical protein
LKRKGKAVLALRRPTSRLLVSFILSQAKATTASILTEIELELLSSRGIRDRRMRGRRMRSRRMRSRRMRSRRMRSRRMRGRRMRGRRMRNRRMSRRTSRLRTWLAAIPASMDLEPLHELPQLWLIVIGDSRKDNLVRLKGIVSINPNDRVNMDRSPLLDLQPEPMVQNLPKDGVLRVEKRFDGIKLLHDEVQSLLRTIDWILPPDHGSKQWICFVQREGNEIAGGAQFLDDGSQIEGMHLPIFSGALNGGGDQLAMGQISICSVELVCVEVSLPAPIGRQDIGMETVEFRADEPVEIEEHPRDILPPAWVDAPQAEGKVAGEGDPLVLWGGPPAATSRGEEPREQLCLNVRVIDPQLHLTISTAFL